ncbi:MAG: hypothetical protein K0V04_04955 [Deltaproteobacteria bacterium]|nr:hypothetical protein [Deltaproteobacteria bacterium]
MHLLDTMIPPTPRTPRAIGMAIERGIAYLADALDPDEGLWRDFTERDGSRGSDVWVSAFVAAHIGGIAQARPMAADVARALLARPRRSGGWGYDQRLLEDADSTAWVLLAAHRSGAGIERPALLGALRLLLRHEDPSGGFVTYGDEGVEIFGHIAGRAGWFSAQPCVSAAALLALSCFASRSVPAIESTARYLSDHAESDGLWHPYWWHGFAYATHHVVDALRHAQQLSCARASAIATAVLRARCADGGWSGRNPGRSTAFATALAMLTLCTLADVLSDAVGDDGRGQARQALEAVRMAVPLLSSLQRADGSFSPSAELLVPGGATQDTLTMVDHGVFTTGCVLHALDEARRVLGGAS